MPSRPIDSLRPNPKNPRTISAQKKKMLSKSLSKFGDLGGIVLNRRSGLLVGGHQRVSAIEDPYGDLKITVEHDTPTKTGTVAEGYLESKGERYAYREVDWDEATEKAANLAANKGAGEFDLDMVGTWLGELDVEGFDLDLTMFDVDERAKLSTEEMDEKSDVEEDLAQVEREDGLVQAGDIWQLGRHRLMCGDSSNVQHIERLMGGRKAQMIYTDPPYGMRLDSDWSGDRTTAKMTGHSKLKGTGRAYEKVIGDDDDFDPSILLGFFEYVPEKFLWGADYYCKWLPSGGSWVVWDKRTRADGQAIRQLIGSEFELCWSQTKHAREICRILWAGLCQGPKEGARVHPTQKPVALSEWFFDRWGKKNDVVVDLYAGSGSALLACEKRSRSMFAMEMHPPYCDTIIARWEKMTGLPAVRISQDCSGMAEEGVVNA